MSAWIQRALRVFGVLILSFTASVTFDRWGIGGAGAVLVGALAGFFVTLAEIEDV